jgi:hypothetical protein
MGKPKGKRPLGRPIHGWEKNIKIELREIGWGGMNWINVAPEKDRWRTVEKTVMNFRVP